MPKRSLQIVGSDDEISDDEEVNNSLLPLGKKGTFEAKPHSSPERVQALGRYLETCGGSASLVQSWTCLVRTKTTCGQQWPIWYDEQNRKFRSRREVAVHFGLQHPQEKKAAAAPSSGSSSSTSSSTALTVTASKDAPFTEADAVMMTVVWATVKGYPPWPAELMRHDGANRFTVRFFATDNEATLPERALKRYNKKQHKLRAGSQGKVSSAALQAQFFEAVKLADQALHDFPNIDDDWRLDGSPWIGKRIRRVFPGGVTSDAVVQSWLPAGEAAEDFALWHVVHDDGDEEDLEEHELEAAAATIEAAGSSAGSAAAAAIAAAAIAAATPVTPAAYAPQAAAFTALSVAGVSLEGMDAVRAALVEMRLESYAPAFETDGWDDIVYLLQIDNTARREIGVSIGMKPGHAMKFAEQLVLVVERIKATAA